MEKYYRDTIIQFDEYSLNTSEDIFASILEKRQDEYDSRRFFIEYLPQETLDNYDFNDPDSLRKFRNDCISMDLKMKMGGCNLRPESIEEDKKFGCLRNAGIKMSDPYGKILGSFDIRDGILTYSPLFPHFYEERDICKFAKDTYFTTMTFVDIMAVLINKADDYFVHTGNSYKIGATSPYILEKVSKDQMIKFVFDSEEGKKIHKRILK